MKYLTEVFGESAAGNPEGKSQKKMNEDESATGR